MLTKGRSARGLAVLRVVDALRPLCAKTGPSSNVAFDPTQTKRVFPDMSSLETKSEIHGYATPA
jgi:hypothetical protein